MPAPVDVETAPFEEEDGALLLGALDEAIQNRDQAGACAAARRYTALGHDAAPLLELLLGVMIEEDGALHAEKYFATQAEEHENARPVHRAEHLVALTRVAASGYGFPAPGLDEARELLTG
jgi:hypothetical protein